MSLFLAFFYVFPLFIFFSLHTVQRDQIVLIFFPCPYSFSTLTSDYSTQFSLDEKQGHDPSDTCLLLRILLLLLFASFFFLFSTCSDTMCDMFYVVNLQLHRCFTFLFSLPFFYFDKLAYFFISPILYYRIMRISGRNEQTL